MKAKNPWKFSDPKRLAFRHELQEKIHYFGLENALEDFCQVLMDCGYEMEDINAETSEAYLDAASKIQNIIEEN